MNDEGYEELTSYLLRNNLKGKKSLEEMDEVVSELKEAITKMRNKILNSLSNKFKEKIKEKKEKGFFSNLGIQDKVKLESRKLSQKDLVNEYKISRPTIKSWEKKGLPSYKVNNGRVFYYEDEVREFVKSHSR